MKKLLLLMIAVTFSISTFSQRDYFVPKTSGYNGFLDLGYSIGVGSGEKTGRVDFTTSHGYQFNPYFFLGAGMGVNVYCQSNANGWSFPVFINPRATLLDSKVSPFIDVKIGNTFGQNVKGFYFSPGVGIHFNSPNTGMRANFTIGYTVQHTSDTGVYSGYDYYKTEPDNKNLGAITLKFGVEF